MEELTMLEELEEIEVPSLRDFLSGVAVGIAIGTLIVT